MPGRTSGQSSSDWVHDVRTDAEKLDNECRRRWGITIGMFRTAKFLFHIATLLFAVYLIEYTPLTTMVAVAVAILLISGPEGLEAYLVRQGVLKAADGGDEQQDTK